MTDQILSPGKVAVVTGAALGIGLAACHRFAALGMNVCLVDIDEDELNRGAAAVAAAAAGAADQVFTMAADVGDLAAMEDLKERVYDRFGATDLLMNNAVTRAGGGVWGDYEAWRRAVDVNLWGVVNGVRAFVPAMMAQGTTAAVINAGSKQGITNPPGNSVYNLTKAAVKSYTESLQHELRNTEGCRVSAHLMIPGWTTTGRKQHRPGAWRPEQVVGRLLEALARGDFYVLCPDDETTPAMDAKRILWAAGDIVENRPPLSRWHGDFGAAYDAYEP